MVFRAPLFIEHICCADWRAANGLLADIFAKPKVFSVDVPDMDDLAPLLEKYAGGSNHFGSVDPCAVEM